MVEHFDSINSGMQNDSNNIEYSSLQEWCGRAILLVDLDAFFASVEQLDHPGWRGKPVIVGGDGDKRGVVSTASYEARKYGVHSAMPSSVARKLCPDAIWTPGNFHRYREVSEQVMNILRDETPYVQQVSIDEAFVDITPTSVNREDPVAIAKRIQERVAQLGVTCSIGLGTTKSIAKIASDLDKPSGLCVVYPGSEKTFLDPLPVKVLSGAGSATQAKLKEMGIETLGQLAQADDEMIERRFGKTGRMLLDRVRGEEDDEIIVEDTVKSVSSETSFAENISSRAELEVAIDAMASKVGRRLRKKGLAGHTLTLKVRYANLQARSNQRKLSAASNDEYLFERHLHTMLDELWHEGVELRLVGVAVSGFDEDASNDQLELFENDTIAEDESRDAELRVQTATDRVKDRFGEDALVYGRDLLMKDTTTGSSSKNPADYK